MQLSIPEVPELQSKAGAFEGHSWAVFSENEHGHVPFQLPTHKCHCLCLRTVRIDRHTKEQYNYLLNSRMKSLSKSKEEEFGPFVKDDGRYRPWVLSFGLGSNAPPSIANVCTG